MSWMRACGSMWNLNWSASSRTRRSAAAVSSSDARFRRLGREHDVLGDRHHRDEHEVLVHHADARGDRGVRRVDRERLPVQEHLALVGLVEPVEDVHQRRLARAVLAEERVHLALAEVEVDRVVREDAREALRDAAELEDGRCRIRPRSSAILRRNGRGRARWPALCAVRVACYLTFAGGLILPATICARRRGDRLQERGGDVRADLAHAHAAVLQVEDEVLATLELAVLRALDGEIHAACRRA